MQDQADQPGGCLSQPAPQPGTAAGEDDRRRRGGGRRRRWCRGCLRRMRSKSRRSGSDGSSRRRSPRRRRRGTGLRRCGGRPRCWSNTRCRWWCRCRCRCRCRCGCRCRRCRCGTRCRPGGHGRLIQQPLHLPFLFLRQLHRRITLPALGHHQPDANGDGCAAVGAAAEQSFAVEPHALLGPWRWGGRKRSGR